MANSIHIQLADAIVTELNATARSWQGTTPKFTAFRSWKPWYKTKEEIAELRAEPKVAVVPLTLRTEWLGRASHKWDYGIMIDVQRIFDLADTQTSAAIDALDSVCQDVQDFLNDGHSITGMTTYIAIEAMRDDVYSPDVLHAQSIWETLIVVGVRGHR